MLDVVQTIQLLGGNAHSRQSLLSDLITGRSSDVTTSALTPYSNTSDLGSQQVTALQNLKDYVDQNVDDDAVAAELQRQIAATEALMELNADDSAVRDPVFSLLSQNAQPLFALSAGSIVNELV